MWSNIKAFAQSKKSIDIVASTVSTIVVLGNSLGLFNLLESELRDRFFRIRAAEGKDEKIVVV